MSSHLDDRERAEMVFGLQPEIARRFLKDHLGDADHDELQREVRTAVASSSISRLDDFHRGVIAIESSLDRDLPEGALAAWVAFSANTALDDASDAGARAWLEDLVAQLRTWLGPHAPPPRGTHDLDRRR
jgi:hypothetical protein